MSKNAVINATFLHICKVFVNETCCNRLRALWIFKKNAIFGVKK